MNYPLILLGSITVKYRLSNSDRERITSIYEKIWVNWKQRKAFETAENSETVCCDTSVVSGDWIIAVATLLASQARVEAVCLLSLLI